MIRVVGRKGGKERYGNIPKEIEEEVLMKLPVKSLMRFKAVSREWRGTTYSKYFIEKHHQYHKSLELGHVRHLVLTEEKNYDGLALENMLVSSSGVVHDSPYAHIRAFNRVDGYKISEPCDGLICLYTNSRIFNIVNPATTSRRRLPNPTFSIGGQRKCTLLGIGRENGVIPRYKLLWFFECDYKGVNESTRCMVFSFDSSTWRYVDPPNCRVHYDHPLIHLDGVMYCMEKQSDFEKVLKLLAFDLHTETCQSISVNPNIGLIYNRNLRMCVLDHCICIFKGFVDYEPFFIIWGLDIDKRSWEMMYSIDVSCFPPDFKESRIISIATINSNVIFSNSKGTIWVFDGSKNSILYHNRSLSFNFVMSYSETLVSPYQ